MMSGDLRRAYAGGDAVSNESSRTLGNGRHSPTSPLKLFGQAKRKINDIFIEIGSYVEESGNFLEESENGVVSKEIVEQAKLYIDKVAGIREMLCRDRMKVAFFGRTSNGKSTVINAMLKDKILPSGIGHTTNCFVQVEGVESQEAYILCEDAPATPRNLQTIGQLAHALSNLKLDPQSLIRICWPKEKCGLLKDDVVLVDSPGIDVSPDLDSWIDNHCLDADVFVLVANAESTLMQTEKNFFHKVSSKLSKPNIFILNNRWDASASEPETMEDVKKQHTERTVAFLVDELKVTNKAEAENRVFFVSARETLVSRANEQKGTPTPTQVLLEGWQSRVFEFCNFERKFEECISQSAVQTKFAQHTDNGKLITTDLRQIMENVLEGSTQTKAKCVQTKQETQDQLDYVEQQLTILTNETKDKIRRMTEEVERKVSTALTEEIRRLANLVDEFDRPFHPDQMLLNVYKKELHCFMEETLSRNLHARCTGFVHQIIEATNHEIEDRMTALLPQDAKQQAVNFVPTQDFEVAYRLDCRNLCADFQEDIEFRFSLGLTSLMHRFLGTKGTRQVLSGYGDIPRPIVSTPQTPSNEVAVDMSNQDTEALIAILSSFTSLYSRTTVGALAITGLIAKAAGWKVLVICGSIYGLVYVYERLTWTRKAKERCFKKQYVDYAGSKLKLIVDLTSSNCSHQVQQELQSTFARLCRHVDLARDELREELSELQKEILKLEEVSTRANFLKNKAGYLDSELNTFIHQYLKPDSRI